MDKIFRITSGSHAQVYFTNGTYACSCSPDTVIQMHDTPNLREE